MLKIPNHLLLYESNIQAILLKASKNINKLNFSNSKYLKEYQQGLIEYIEVITRAVVDGIAIDLKINPSTLKKSFKLGMNDLVRIANGNITDDDLLYKTFFSRLRKKFSFFAGWLKKFNFNRGKKVEPVKFKKKIVYNPETKKPLTNAGWNNIENGIVDFLGDKLENLEDETIVRTALAGKLAQRIEQEGIPIDEIDDYSYDKLQEKSGIDLDDIDKAKKKLELNKQERYALEYAKDKAGEYLSIEDGDIRNRIVQSVRDVITGGLEEGLSKQEMISRLYWHDPSDVLGAQFKNDSIEAWNRDFRRIIVTETSMAHNNGYIMAHRAVDPTKDIYFIFQKGGILPNSSKRCIGFSGTLVKFSDDPLTDDTVKKDKFGAQYYIWHGKNNVGRSEANWWIAIPMHPNCIDRFVHINPEEQMYDEETGKILYKAA